MKKLMFGVALMVGMSCIFTEEVTYAEEADLEFILDKLNEMLETTTVVDSPDILDPERINAPIDIEAQEMNQINEPVSLTVTTGTYGDGYDSDEYDSLEEYLKEARTETFEGAATLEIIEVLRGEDVYEHVSDEPYEYLTDPLEGHEWALISFTYEWGESEDTRPLLMSRVDFKIYDTDGTKVDNESYYLAFEGGFDQVYTEVGQELEETMIKLVPENEPFILEYGDDIFFEKVYFELE